MAHGLVFKLPDSWKEYKHRYSHHRTYLNLQQTIVDIQIEETNRMSEKVSRAKELTLTSSKTLSLNNVLHVPHFRHNLISVHMLGKVGIKVSFAGGIVTLTKNEVFVGKGCNDEVSLYLMLIKLLIKMVHLLVLT